MRSCEETSESTYSRDSDWPFRSRDIEKRIGNSLVEFHVPASRYAGNDSFAVANFESGRGPDAGADLADVLVEERRAKFAEAADPLFFQKHVRLRIDPDNVLLRVVGEGQLEDGSHSIVD